LAIGKGTHNMTYQAVNTFSCSTKDSAECCCAVCDSLLWWKQDSIHYVTLTLKMYL